MRRRRVRAFVVRGGRVVDPGEGVDLVGDVVVADGRVAAVAPSVECGPDVEVVDARGCLVVPTFTDLHVHLREPGGEESETIATGTDSALAGGFGRVYAMPNTSPTADRPEVVATVLRAAAAAGPCEVVPVSAITTGLRGRALVDMRAMAAAGAGAFSDDGSWVASDALATAAFREAAEHEWLLMEHCEDFACTGAGVLHDGPATRGRGVIGIPREAEDRATARDLELARSMGTRLHLCHVSTAGAVAALRRAKDAGLAVSGEVTPHHLLLTVADALAGGPDFKMKPPLRDPSDVEALVRALDDGTLDAIGTDHAPHAEAKKRAGLAEAPFGAIGLETAFPVLFTRLVETGRIGLSRLLDAMIGGPARVARRAPPAVRVGAPASLAWLDVETVETVDRSALRSKSRNCPFHGMPLTGWTRGIAIGDVLIDIRESPRAKAHGPRPTRGSADPHAASGST